MDELKELIQVVGRNKIKRLGSIRLSDPDASQVNQLYTLIAEGKVEDHKAAMRRLFAGRHTDSAFRNIKAGLQQRLINMLMFIDFATDRQRAYHACYRNYAAACILLGKGVKLISIRLCEEIFAQAEHFEFTELALDVARILYRHYSMMGDDFETYRKYQQKCVYYQELYHRENLAEDMYSELVINQVNSKQVKQTATRKAHEYARRLAPLLAETHSYWLQLYGVLIQLFGAMSTHDSQATLAIADRALAIFSAKPYEAHTPIQICLHHQLAAYVQLQQYAAGREVATRCLSYLEEGSFNWFRFYESYFQLLMHAAEYQEAGEIYATVTRHERFEFLPANVREIWDIYLAYLIILAAILTMLKILNKGEASYLAAWRIHPNLFNASLTMFTVKC